MGSFFGIMVEAGIVTVIGEHFGADMGALRDEVSIGVDKSMTPRSNELVLKASPIISDARPNGTSRSKSSMSP